MADDFTAYVTENSIHAGIPHDHEYTASRPNIELRKFGSQTLSYGEATCLAVVRSTAENHSKPNPLDRALVRLG
jgi:hypothetical protein